ncbi:hypothetical protein BGM26_03655 [Bacillus sp. FJAT-29790]|uniref:hypothetical protein n=1 Tax=Bacillus sp. FJAT-29790 TaxID=1895002 RepID=UPI001C24007D|nr:hypothetical protein [Bacillus sp. FJAT-29790]MBU8878087.1 hypothetical protein [Bacillus sp. FJAT-29790]
MRSIKSKLLVVIVPIIYISLVLVAWMNHNKAKEFLEANFEELSFIHLENTQTMLDDAFRIHIDRLKALSIGTGLIS